MRQIIDREERGRFGERRIRAVRFPQIDRHEAALPVAAVNDIREKLQRLARLKNAARKINEAFGVIRVIALRIAVQVIAAIISVMLEKIDRHSAERAFQYRTRLFPGGNRRVKLLDARRQAKRGLIGHFIFGRHHADIMAETA